MRVSQRILVLRFVTVLLLIGCFALPASADLLTPAEHGNDDTTRFLQFYQALLGGDFDTFLWQLLSNWFHFRFDWDPPADPDIAGAFTEGGTQTSNIFRPAVVRTPEPAAVYLFLTCAGLAGVVARRKAAKIGETKSL